MSYVILDLEWNSAYSHSNHCFINEIIEFGAVKTDDDFRITDTFDALIKPKISKKLTGRVKKLTKLTNEKLREDGDTFLNVTREFTEFLGDSVMMTWGTTDLFTLMENYRYYKHDGHIPFLSRYCDAQEYCEKAMGRYDEGNQIGLGACAELLGVTFSEEEQHRADSDAALSLKCILKFTDSFSIYPFVRQADCQEFYDRLLFKNYFITDLHSPVVDRSQMKFRCDKCGDTTRRVKRWRLHNKGFVSDFYCKSCGRKFSGKVSFKQKYDEVKVNKRIFEISEKEKSDKKTDAQPQNQ
ncbi:MAG: exonuclease domain-containing protein [Ruminococcus sp.]|nr:exonuclease domain-containing protein [Ruminococcus sp.]